MLIETYKFGARILTWAMMAVITSHAAYAEEATTFAELKLDGKCDERNHKLWVFNRHDTKSLLITVQWKLLGSKRLITDKFQLPALAPREIGCAAQADIINVEFVAS